MSSLIEEEAEEDVSFRGECVRSSKSTTRLSRRQQQHQKPYSKMAENVDHNRHNHTKDTIEDVSLNFSSFSKTVTTAGDGRNCKQFNLNHQSFLTNDTTKTNDINNQIFPDSDSTLSGSMSSNNFGQFYSKKSNFQPISTEFLSLKEVDSTSSNSKNNTIKKYHSTKETLSNNSKLSRFIKSTIPTSEYNNNNNNNNNKKNVASKPSKWSNFLTSTTATNLSSDEDDGGDI